MELELFEIVHQCIEQEMVTLQARTVDLATDMEQVLRLEAEVQAAIGEVVLRAQKKEAAHQLRVQHLQARQEAATLKASELATQEAALKAAVAREEVAAKARAAKRQMIAGVRAAISEKEGHAAVVQEVEMKGQVVGGEFRNLKILIEHYVVDLNAISNDGRSPLFLAASFLMYKLLLDNGAERSGVDDHGRTALMHYAYAAHFQLVEYCVRKEQFQLDAKDDEGKTALHWACARNNNF